MNMTTNTTLLRSLVELSAMVFGAMPPEDALQSFADALGVQVAAIGRIDHTTGAGIILAQNAKAPVVAASWTKQLQSVHGHVAVLDETDKATDLLIIQDRKTQLGGCQIRTVSDNADYLKTLWTSRLGSFDRALSKGRSPAAQNILHPDNPYALTPTEMRVCALIAAGHRPATISHTMKTSMPTVRTHLRNIYTKTGLDGMVGVMRNLQLSSDNQQVAG